MNRNTMEQKPEHGRSGITWILNDDGILTIRGDGRIPDADCGRAPAAEWAAVKEKIREVRVEEGVEAVGINAFRGCTNLTRVFLSYTVSRIRAYAFRDCASLEEVESERSAFRILGDPTIDDPEDTVIFGTEAFHGTPWIRRCFGSFYIQGGELYTAFAEDGEDVVIPDDVRVLRPNSLAHLSLNSLILPSDLRIIQNFAFSETRVAQEMILPASVTTLEEYALADTGIIWKDSPLLRQAIDRVSPAERERFPAVIRPYTVSLKHRKAYGEYRRLSVIRRSRTLPASFTEDCSVPSGPSVYRRIRQGSVLICVKFSRNRVLCVESFIWNGEKELVNEYLLYPVRECRNVDAENDTLALWRDSFTWQEKEDIIDAFDPCGDGAALAESGVLREPGENVREEWFRSGDRENFGGPLELDFLRMWLPLHPGIQVDTTEENREHDRYRRFVPI